MNILILSCGTRNKLVEYFKRNRDDYDKVIGTDCSELAPALYACDAHYIVPRMSEPNYLECILDICRKENVKAVLPLFEDELVLISEHKDLFEKQGIVPIVSNAEAVKLCRDKAALYKFLSERNIPVVPVYCGYDEFIYAYENGSISFPVFIKPQDGAGSVNSMKVDNMSLLKALCDTCKEDMIIQPFIEGIEYGSDTYADMVSNEVTSIFTKRKIRMRAGETEKAVSIKDDALFKLIKETAEAVGLNGPVDMDIFYKDGNFYILEINPRFGGGFPHAYECGVNFMHMIANNLNGIANKNTLGEYPEGVTMLKYTDLITINE